MTKQIARLFAVLLLCQAYGAVNAMTDEARFAMAEAMVRMMEAMGLFGSVGGGMSSLPQGWSSPMGMSGWPSALGAMPGVPGSMPMGVPSMPGMDPMTQMRQFDPSAQRGRLGDGGAAGSTDPLTQPMTQMGQMMERFPGTAPMLGMMPLSGSPLEGLWEGNDEGLLIVQGGRYRLYAPYSGYIDGDIRIAEDRLELSNRREGFVQEFEFAQDQGRLVLRDAYGQLYLYRRLNLDEPR